uniref:DNA-directed DNA polymerase n=1 Tax=Lanius cristatus densovirus TaxID=2794498 RepID=A0A8A4XDD4_9VIRU|nr:MAG: PolB [Lanius cristatus densovirus]
MATRIPPQPEDGYFLSPNSDEIIDYLIRFAEIIGPARVVFHAECIFQHGEAGDVSNVHLPTITPFNFNKDTANLRDLLQSLIDGTTADENITGMEQSNMILQSVLSYHFTVIRHKPTPTPPDPEAALEDYIPQAVTEYNNSFLNALCTSQIGIAIRQYKSQRRFARIKMSIDEWCETHNIDYETTPWINISNLPAWNQHHPEFNIQAWNKDGDLIYFFPHNYEMPATHLLWNNQKFMFINDINRWFGVQRNLKKYCTLCKRVHDPANTCVQVETITEDLEMYRPDVPDNQRHQLVIYADFEAIVTPDNEHQASGYAYVAINGENEIMEEQLRDAKEGGNLAASFFKDVQSFYNRTQMHLDRDDVCPHCKMGFEGGNNSGYRGRCFCHGDSGRFHYGCWMNNQNFMLIYFHNLRGYDSHILLKEFSKFQNPGNISVGGKSFEKLDMMKYKGARLRIKILDTFPHLSTSLANLVKECKTWKHTPAEDRGSKGLFPYSWFNSLEKFNQPMPTTKEDWFNDLTREHVDPTDAIKEYRDKGFTKFKQWHDHYLMLDVKQLADVFQEFRATCLEECQMDPVYYLGAPSFSLSLALRQQPEPFYLLHDVEIYKDIQSQIRGGVSQCCKRYATAHQPGEYLKYLDVNGLYAYCMMQTLPNKYITTFDDNQTENYIRTNYEFIDNDAWPHCLLVKCDIDYPLDLHDKHYQFPLMPHRYNNRLCTTLYDKKEILIHWRHLKFLCEQGLKVSNYHYSYLFTQNFLLRDFVQNNVTRRQATKDPSKSTLYKLLNNAVYGKTCENVYKYQKYKIVEMRDKQNGEVNTLLGNAKNWLKLSDNTALGNFRQEAVDLCKPVHIGYTVLEYAKMHIEKMLVMQWNTFGTFDCELCYTDTDSILMYYKNQPQDPLITMLQRDFPLDMENVPEGFPVHTEGTNKVPGLWSDESGGNEITEFVGLRAKTYAIKFADNKETKKNKGVVKSAEKQDGDKIHFQDYYDTLFEDKRIYVNQHILRSTKHVVHTINQRRLALANLDEKRQVLADRINTLPHGYNGTRFNNVDIVQDIQRAIEIYPDLFDIVDPQDGQVQPADNALLLGD